ncbi:Aspartic peptidase [Artemisia annua]|uniref:Aspartic peptidase n=1 Tax=Artemisia annua TaxID=35608 RepID=A0A2U1KPX8_ARTAN|nr:Aspartic peptidase [Artemisia annua]
MAFSSFAFAIILAILYIVGCIAIANGDTFSIDLIHRDSVDSPFYDSYQGEFLLNISNGNPLHQVLAIADTGSDLSWIQCEPCIHCYNHTGLLFNPHRSSTYKPVTCDTNTCKVIGIIDANCSLTRNCPL